MEASSIDSVYTKGLNSARLQFQSCTDCSTVRFPPSIACPNCGSHNFDVVGSDGRGVVVSWGIPRRPRLPSPPSATDKTVVLVELTEGVRVLGHYMDEEGEPPAIALQVTASVGEFDGRPIPVFRKA